MPLDSCFPGAWGSYTDAVNPSDYRDYEVTDAGTQTIKKPRCKDWLLGRRRFGNLEWRRANQLINGIEKRSGVIQAVRQDQPLIAQLLAELPLLEIHRSRPHSQFVRLN